MAKQSNDKPNDKGENQVEAPTPFKRKKLPPHFVDEVSNISIAPNGASRIHFHTWSTDDEGQPVRIDAELIMTTKSLEALADALPKAISQAQGAMENS